MAKKILLIRRKRIYKCAIFHVLLFRTYRYIYLMINVCLLLGNGPSGICLSYLLSGYTPYVKEGAVHPNPLLQRKLEEFPGVPITEQVCVLLYMKLCSHMIIAISATCSICYNVTVVRIGYHVDFEV